MSVLIYIYISVVVLLILADVYLLLTKSKKSKPKKVSPQTKTEAVLDQLTGAAPPEEPVEEPVIDEADEAEPETASGEEIETKPELEKELEIEPALEGKIETEPEPEPVIESEPEPELDTESIPGSIPAEDIVQGDENPLDFSELESQLSAFKSEAGIDEEYGDDLEAAIAAPAEDVSVAEATAAAAGILDRLAGTDSMVRFSAAQEASHFSNRPDVVTALIRCLDDESRQVRTAAAATLEYSDDERVIEPLISYLQDIDNDILEQSQRVFDLKTTSVGRRLLRNAEEDEFKRWPVVAGDEGLDITPLTRVLQDRNIDFRGRAEDLEDLEAQEVGGELKNIAVDGAVPENVRSLAIYALGRMQDVTVGQEICAILDESSPSLRYTSALALAEIGDSGTIDVLLKHLKDDNRFVRSAVAYALGRLGDSDVVLPLVESLNDSEEGVRHTLWKSLREIRDHDPDTVRKTLESALHRPDADLRKYAAEAAGKLDEKNLAPLLLEMLESGDNADAETQLAIAGALVELEDLEAVTLLIEASRKLDDEFKTVVQRMSSASAKAVGRHTDPLGSIRSSLKKRNLSPELLASVDTTAGYYATASSEDLTYFREAMKNSSMYVRGCAVYQLDELEDPEVAELLLGALKDRSSYVRGAAAEVLGLRAENRAVKPLIKLAREATIKDVRLKAIKALGRLTDPVAEKALKKLAEEKDLDVVRYARVALKSFSSS